MFAFGRCFDTSMNTLFFAFLFCTLKVQNLQRVKCRIKMQKTEMHKMQNVKLHFAFYAFSVAGTVTITKTTTTTTVTTTTTFIFV